MICAPPRDRAPTGTRDRDQEWIRNHWSCRPRDARAILKTSVTDFSTKYSNIQRSEWAAAMESEISRDLSAMQQHPAIMVQHRRYVVLRNERTTLASSQDGVSYDTLTLTRTDFISSWSGLRLPNSILKMISSQNKARCTSVFGIIIAVVR